MKSLISELKEAQFKPITFSIFNKLDEEYRIHDLQLKLNEKFSIYDFEYYELNLEKKDQFRIKMHNKEFINEIKLIQSRLKNNALLDIDFDNGSVKVIRLKNKEIL